MNIDWTLNIGQIFSALVFIGVLIYTYAGTTFKLESMEKGQEEMKKRMDGVGEELKKQTDILVNQAKQSERINALERRIDDLYDRFHPAKVVVNAQAPT